jgi:methanogenic corrinoid protein MtbC1
MNQASFLDEPEQGHCDPADIQAEAVIGAAQAAMSPQERLARIVRSIEQDIIPKLVRAHRDPVEPVAAVQQVQVTAEDLALFMPRILATDDAPWQSLLEQLLARGITVDEIYLGLLTPAARELGRMWEEDTCSFTDVTVALGRMQRVMRMLSPAFGREVGHPADGRRVLLLPAPGEQHTFGLSIVAEFFRRAGWEVVGDTEARAADPAALVRREWFDVIGISVGIESRLDWLKSGIAAVRNASRNRAIGVMVGGPVFVANPERAADVGADGTAVDGRQAPVMAEQLLEQRLRRL